MSDTSSPLAVDESNLPRKQNQRVQPNEFVKTPPEGGKESSVSSNEQTGKLIQDEGEDSNHALSVARYNLTLIIIIVLVFIYELILIGGSNITNTKRFLKKKLQVL